MSRYYVPVDYRYHEPGEGPDEPDDSNSVAGVCELCCLDLPEDRKEWGYIQLRENETDFVIVHRECWDQWKEAGEPPVTTGMFADDADYDPREWEDRDEIDFADPGGHSALRAATPENPRNLPCPNCGKPNRITPADRALHYQCDECADKAEGRIPDAYY